MSLSLALANGLSGLTASQGGLATISQNVSNANTVGYSRQVTQIEQQVIDGVGVGVTITGIERIVDQFLIRDLRVQRAALGESEVVDLFYNQLQSRFGTPESNRTISANIAEFAAALDILANNPEDPSLRFDVIAAGQRFAKNISGLADSIQKLRAQADTGIKTAVDEINAQLRVIDDLNGAIAKAQVIGGNTAALEDQRDQAILKIAENIDIKTFALNSGRISILTDNGLTLLDNDLHRLDYTPAATVTNATVFGAITITPIDPETGAALGGTTTLVTSGTSSAVTSNVISGRLDGLLDIRDKTLNDLARQVDTLAAAVRDEYNKVHNNGAAFPAPNVLTGTTTVAGGDAFQGSGKVRIAIVDSAGTIVGIPLDLDLTALGATDVNGLMTAINTALGANTATIVNGKLVLTASTGNGIAINELDSQITGTTQAFSDFFGLNDFFVGTGSTDFAVRPDIVTNPGLVATAQMSLTSAVQSLLITDRTKTLDDTDSFNVATDGTFTINGTAPANTISFDVDVDTIDTLATKINNANISGITATVVSGGGNSARLVINSTNAIIDIQFGSGGNLVTAANFSAVAPTETTGITIGDNRAVQALASVTETAVTFAAVGGLLAGSLTLGEYAGAITGFNAVKASDAARTAELQKDLFNDLDHRITSFSGVNIDEEMANVILFQNAFVAAARMITATDEMFEILVNMV